MKRQISTVYQTPTWQTSTRFRTIYQQMAGDRRARTTDCPFLAADPPALFRFVDVHYSWRICCDTFRTRMQQSIAMGAWAYLPFRPSGWYTSCLWFARMPGMIKTDNLLSGYPSTRY